MTDHDELENVFSGIAGGGVKATPADRMVAAVCLAYLRRKKGEPDPVPDEVWRLAFNMSKNLPRGTS